jgi:protein-S-isoprenylcysteine O-methyltransferase Ste14
MKDQLEKKAYLIVLVAGLLNIAVLPLWPLAIAKATAQVVGYPLFGLGLALNLLSLLTLKRGFGGEIEPVTKLVTGGIYA